MMSKELLLKYLEECNTGDEEKDHAKADSLLLDYIDDAEITEAFMKVEKWYA